MLIHLTFILVVCGVVQADLDACDNAGECHQSPIIGAGPALSLEECKEQCQSNSHCDYFTWYELEDECFLFSGCDFNASTCTDCYSGAVNCSLYTCFQQGLCYGGLLEDHDYFNDAEKCLEFCQETPKCQWFNFNPEQGNLFVLTSTCPEVATDCTECLYGQVECQTSDLHVMVAIGNNAGQMDRTEVVNMDSVSSCPNMPAKFPTVSDRAVAMKHNSRMVICGGYPYTSDCYGYSNDRWDIEAFKLEPTRRGATSVEVRPGEWLVMGGCDENSNYLADTKLLKNGIFIEGPALPEPMEGGSSVMFNATHVFVAAGRSQLDDPAYSSQNYFLNIDTEQWTRIANRTSSPYYYHSSGTFYNSTAGEIQIGHVGKFGIEVYSPQDDSWRQLPLPSPLTELYLSAVLRQAANSFTLIGGYTNLGNTGDVYLFDENGLSIQKQNVLAIPRNSHVAMSISKSEFTCN